MFGTAISFASSSGYSTHKDFVGRINQLHNTFGNRDVAEYVNQVANEYFDSYKPNAYPDLLSAKTSINENS